MADAQTTRTASDRPWEALPLEAYPALVPHLPGLTEEIIEAIGREVPAYARPLEGAFGETVRRGVEQALAQFVEMAVKPGVGRAAGRSLYVELGRGEAQAGRSLEALLAAYRVGARVAWRRLARVGLEEGLTPETLVVFAESIFAYIDELSAESAEGYSHEQAERAGEFERRRAALIEMLVQRPPAPPAAVTEAAETAHWRLPARLCVAVWPAEAGRRPVAHLPVGSIAAIVEGVLCAVVPDPDGPGRLDELARALGRVPAGIGSSVPWAEARRSFRRAGAALGLAHGGGDARPVMADERRVDLVLRSHPTLVAELREDRLAPLAGETELSRRRLSDTLLAWLRHQGSITAAAEELIVHPQTVRYRLGRLRELFGDVLDDPDMRFELELVLRAAPLLPAGGDEDRVTPPRATARQARERPARGASAPRA